MSCLESHNLWAPGKPLNTARFQSAYLNQYIIPLVMQVTSVCLSVLGVYHLVFSSSSALETMPGT